jgi:MtN3 and saliva related transmembrane protein
MAVARVAHMVDALGWVSSVILLATIMNQIHKQWQERSGKGVSRFLFIGQTLASVGFTVYSALLHNWVFTLTNAALLVSAIVGWAITTHFKRAAESPSRTAPQDAAVS